MSSISMSSTPYAHSSCERIDRAKNSLTRSLNSILFANASLANSTQSILTMSSTNSLFNEQNPILNEELTISSPSTLSSTASIETSHTLEDETIIPLEIENIDRLRNSLARSLNSILSANISLANSNQSILTISSTNSLFNQKNPSLYEGSINSLLSIISLATSIEDSHAIENETISVPLEIEKTPLLPLNLTQEELLQLNNQAHLLNKIVSAHSSYQLDMMISELASDETMTTEEVMLVMRTYEDKYKELVGQEGCCYRAFFRFHALLESSFPYVNRSGQYMKLSLLSYALFAENKGLISALWLAPKQASTIGDIASSVLFHIPTVVYQFPKFVDDVNSSIENERATSTVLVRSTVYLANLFLAISPLFYYGGAKTTASVFQALGMGVNLCDVPVGLAILIKSWSTFLGTRNSQDYFTRYVAKEICHKSTLRAFTQSVSAIAPFAGKILVSMELANAQNMLGLLALNTLNLFMHQSPYTVMKCDEALLKRNDNYQFSGSVHALQHLALHVDMTKSKEITEHLDSFTGAVRYSFNLKRLSDSQEMHCLKSIFSACSTGKRRPLTESQSTLCCDIVDRIYTGEGLPESEVLDLLPDFVQVILLKLATCFNQDRKSLCFKNQVYEKIISPMLKTLCFRETVLNISDQA